jgi:hypothetical protein
VRGARDSLDGYDRIRVSFSTRQAVQMSTAGYVIGEALGKGVAGGEWCRLVLEEYVRAYEAGELPESVTVATVVRGILRQLRASP